MNRVFSIIEESQKMSLEKIFSAIILMISALFTTTCEYLKETFFPEPPPYTIIDSGIPAADEPAYWIDNDRVIFIGHKKVTQGEHKGKYMSGLFTWKLGELPEFYRRFKGTYGGGGLCYAEGYIYYSEGWFYDPPNPPRGTPYVEHAYHRKGKFGNEKLIHKVRRSKGYYDPNAPKDYATGRRNYLTCRYEPLERYVDSENKRRLKLLRDGDGYLDVGPVNKSHFDSENHIKLFKPGVKEGIELPIEKTYTFKIGYAPFKNAYYMIGRPDHIGWQREWRGRNCEPLWWLTQDGNATKECIPYAKFRQNKLPYFVPTRKGVVMRTLKLPSENNSGDSGLYLMHEGVLTKLIGGLIQVGLLGRVAVSPDGCKLAFTHVKTVAAERRSLENRRLKVIDLCEEDSNEQS